MTNKKMPVLGKTIEEQPEELKNNQQKDAEKKLQVMNDLDKIKVPIMCTVITYPHWSLTCHF